MMTEKVTLSLNEQRSDFALSDGKSCSQLNPQAMLLFATARCAGLTALQLMQKEKVQPAGFEIVLSGELSTPTLRAESVYRSFEIQYNVHCDTMDDQAKISIALNLTQEKYCGMLRMLRMIAPVAHRIAIVSTEPQRV